MTSPIVIDEDGAAPAGFSGGNNDFEFGVDPNIDPELALVSFFFFFFFFFLFFFSYNFY